MKISIIVCTFNRSHAITKCLDSIAASLAAAAPVEGEIVVIDNASTDDTSAIVKKWAENCAFPVQALYEPKQGVSAARNNGIRAARGELLVFTDDDCHLSKNHVMDALRYDAADIVPVLRGGRVELGDKTDLRVTILDAPEPRRWQRLESGKYKPIGSGFILGCNMTMRRALAERIGFFDERIGPGTAIISAGEDTDYIFRAYNANVIIEYVPDMTVFHFHGRKTAAEGKKLFQSYAIGEGALYAKYLFKEPNFCRQFYWDFRYMVRDIILGRNGHIPEIDFSYKDKIVFNLRGFLKYITDIGLSNK
jgi:glycosyltransferase involved in cell wall biosynthesis